MKKLETMKPIKLENYFAVLLTRAFKIEYEYIDETKCLPFKWFFSHLFNVKTVNTVKTKSTQNVLYGCKSPSIQIKTIRTTIRKFEKLFYRFNLQRTIPVSNIGPYLSLSIGLLIGSIRTPRRSQYTEQ